ncbi:MAG TPA: hypothetical protein DCZ93_02905 [Elusimicrobia bacterium]|nr:hypothetical protein [Elusimicrobiota bacterium]
MKKTNITLAAGLMLLAASHYAPACAADLENTSVTWFAKSRQLTEAELRDLLRDPAPEVRKAAVRASRRYILANGTSELVIAVLKNAGERADIRVEAARVLSYPRSNSRAQDALQDVIRFGDQPGELRVMAYKALWDAAGVNSRCQDFLVAAVRREERDAAARRAAIWALWGSVTDPGPREMLKDLLKYGDEDEETKAETIKSLYRALPGSDVKDLVFDIARDRSGSQPKAVRLPAILALAAVSHDQRVRDVLEEIAERSSDQDLRLAAIEALSQDMRRIQEYFHLGFRTQNQGFISPIETE